MRIPFLPWRKKKEILPVKKTMKKVVVGLIIGGAIGSIIGKKLLEDRHARHVEKEDTKD